MAGVWLENLEVQRVRQISRADLELSRGVNWIIGGNGAGKTTLLESVFLLGRGKSFRGSRYGGLVQRGQRDALVHADVVEIERRRRIGIRQSTEGTRWSENGARRSGLDDLGVRVHVRVIGENAQRLVEGDPELRRWFLDWNLFHVEPRYRAVFSGFRRVLGQRNAWLRAGGAGRAIWDDAYVAAAESLTDARRSFVDAMAAVTRDLSGACGLDESLSVDLNPGWPVGESLAGRLDQTRAGDISRGYTWYGPARADLELRVNGRGTLGSRGENKTIVAVLQLAANKVWNERGIECVWLLDDLISELSAERMGAIWAAVVGTGAQVVATSLRPPPYAGTMFHVERGQVVRGA